MSEISDRLQAPFPANSIEWRIDRCGKNDKGIWATVFAYVTNRAIQTRLDEVFGPGGWSNEFKQFGTGILCGISCKFDGEWVTKWDGALETEVKGDNDTNFKGGLSGAQKRAASQLGIGRYLYELETMYAKISPEGKLYGKLGERDGGGGFKWDPPGLPAWALPSTTLVQKQPEAPKEPEKPKITLNIPSRDSVLDDIKNILDTRTPEGKAIFGEADRIEARDQCRRAANIAQLSAYRDKLRMLVADEGVKLMPQSEKDSIARLAAKHELDSIASKDGLF